MSENRCIASAILLFCLLAPALRADDDILIADFEGNSYGEWIADGTAFGPRPARGTLAGQQEVTGFRGRGLVNTFLDGDKAVGTLTSPAFRISRDHLAFLIGGGDQPGEVGIELLIDDRAVRSATGANSELLHWHTWDVRTLQGKQARIRIFDRARGGFGHVNVDHILLTDKPRKGAGTWRLEEYRKSPEYYREAHRPQFHFSPEMNWMNDPNGLVFHKGEYHLFYQHNPHGNSWGHMSWGHAVSRDLVHWQHLPIALHEEYGVMIFSGCAVVDWKNSSGFGRGDESPLVAIYTGHGHGKQTQDLAFSNDRGRTWTKYADNPVLDIGEADFRDPKVFWHEPTQRWIMVVSLAAKKVLVFYASSDLKQWKELSRFGPAGAKDKPNWECPDLFPLPVEGEEGKKLWVLEADMGSGSVAGGSGGEYFVGQFDGTRFAAIQDAQWVDFGRDFYAPVSWSDMPNEDGRRIWIGWLNNWETNRLPTRPWRGAMSIPRTLSLRKVPAGNGEAERYVLVQRPVRELRTIHAKPTILDASKATWPPLAITKPGDLADMSFVLESTLKPGIARSCGIRIRTAAGEFTEVGYDGKHAAVYVDRRQSGIVDFHQAFAGRHEAPTRLINGEVRLQLFVDRSSIEVFINDGEAVISDRIFPSTHRPTIEAFAGDESATVVKTSLSKMRSIWHP